jgi:hypothetical protein
MPFKPFTFAIRVLLLHPQRRRRRRRRRRATQSMRVDMAIPPPRQLLQRLWQPHYVCALRAPSAVTGTTT